MPSGPNQPANRGLAILIGLILGSCADQGPEGPAILVQSGSNQATVAGTPFPDSLHLQVVGPSGPASGVEVLVFPSYVIGPAPGVPRQEASLDVLITQGAPAFSDIGPGVAIEADAQGRVGFGVEAGEVAGIGKLHVRVPSLSLTSEVSFTIAHGPEYRLRAEPQDSAVLLGSAYAIRSVIVDRYWNPIREAGAPRSLVPSVVSVTGSSVEGAQYGVGSVVVEAPGFADTVQVSVVPDGTIAAIHKGNDGSLSALVTFRTDLSRYDSLYTLRGAYAIDAMRPDWHPGGTDLVLPSWDRRKLLSVGIDGGETTLLHGRELEDPQYSSDGMSVHYTSPGWRTQQLWRLGTSTGDIEAYGPPSEPSVEFRFSSTSPDGSEVVYQRHSGHFADLGILSLTTSDVRVLDIDARSPRWSPVDDRIAYLTPVGDLMITDAQGSQITSVTHGQSHRGWIDWSPDAEWIAAIAWHPSPPRSNEGLVLIQVETGLVIPVPGTEKLYNPAWRPF